MKKVLIIGGNGSGKSTMAKELAQITKLPLVHLDTLYWTDGWVPRDREEFLRLLQNQLEKPTWILDGNMRRTLPKRLEYADTVIYLDFSGISCFFGVFKRVFSNYGKTRADMGDNCPEKFDVRTLKFLFGTLSFNKKNRQYFYDCIKSANGVTLIVLKRRKEVKRFLEELKL